MTAFFIGGLLGVVAGFCLSQALQHWDVVGPAVARLFGK